ncbi:MAG: RidA family protein [Armatimonadota bacterium]|nr:RidA family protein [Armatimonadota bacterium]
MPKSIVSTDKAPTVGPYSQAVKANGFIFVSGQIPMDASTGRIVSDEVKEQAKRVLDNLKLVLEAAGSSLENIVKTTIYLIDMNDFAVVNEIYGSYFKVDPPARATVEVCRLPKDVKIEIEAVALEK